jgi:hypothetical protein
LKSPLNRRRVKDRDVPKALRSNGDQVLLTAARFDDKNDISGAKTIFHRLLELDDFDWALLRRFTYTIRISYCRPAKNGQCLLIMIDVRGSRAQFA